MRRARSAVARLVALSFYLGMFPWTTPVRRAEANVNPITAITRQVQKSNMLVVLDTSGSMTGVPGGGFGAASEVGVDCEDGVNCRPVMMTGACQATPTKLCSNDEDCHEGVCQDGADPCMVDADCPFTSGTCSATGIPCQYSSDCSPTPGICNPGGQACSSAVPCPATAGTCSKDGAACTVGGAACSPAKYCSNNPATTCVVNTDCGSAPDALQGGLVAGYYFDENGGTTANDFSGNGNTATLNAGAGWGTGHHRAGMVTAANTGASAPFSPSIGSITSATGLTLAAWVKRTTNPGYDTAAIARWETGVGNRFNLRVGPQGLPLVCGNIGNNGVCDGGDWFTENTWHHIAFTWDGTNGAIYVDGSQKVVAPVAGPLGTTGTDPLNIGASWIGPVDDARVYNRALSPDEIAVLGENGLVAWYDMEGPGPTVADGQTIFDGTAMGGYSFVPGKFGNGIQLDGTSGYVNIPVAMGSALDIRTNYSISMWINRTRSNTAGSGIYDSLVSRQCAAGTWQPSFHFQFDDTNLLKLEEEGSYDTADLPFSQNNQWVNVVTVYDGTNAGKLYINGVSAMSGAGNGAYAPSSSGYPIEIGAYAKTGGVNGSFFKGIIDDVKIYDRALTAAEVAAHGPGAGTCVTNTCNGTGNVCSAGVNVCTGSNANKCNGANATDKCVISAAATGPAKMCRVEQKLCAVDSQCTMPGDACGPATSRAAVAKRVLKSVMARNYDLVNFGMMTFTTGGYFPYYPATTTSTITDTKYLMREQLEVYGCFDPVTGPAASCTIGTTPHVLRIGKNSRYSVNRGPGGFENVDQSWCNETCALAGGQGTGTYQGSYYDYTVTVGTYDYYAKPKVLPAFQGRVTNIGGIPHSYYKPRSDYYWNSNNGSNRPPMKGPVDCNGCSSTCGGTWDPTIEPALDYSDNTATARASMMSMLPRLEPAENGGIMSWERTPTGCTLYNKNDTPDLSKRIAAGMEKYYSAYHYLKDVITNDPKSKVVAPATLPCRRNSVLLITDGMANGPGDVNNWGATLCDTPACGAADPAGAGCQCAAVLAAQKMKKDLGVTTYVVGFGADVSKSVPRTINDNIARAGGTTKAFLAQNELELQNSVQTAIFDSVAGSYETSPATASSGQQGTNGIVSGTLALDARVDFPKWQGHLLAYDISTATPTLAWDAGNFFTDTALGNAGAASFWRRRRVWTSDGVSMIQVQIDPNTGAITNKATLRALGLGSTDAEAELIARWMLGDPAMKNRHPLGAFVNSTPIDVASPGNSPTPGGAAFYAKYKSRPALTYVGSDDGMLHAFFTRPTTVGGTTYAAGSEAFAFIPPDMLKTITKVYAQGGQHADPNQHVFGLASSAKVKNVCTANCTSDTGAVWKTILSMNEGPGGNNAFMLDITDPTDAGGITSPPVKMMWHTDTVSPAATTTYDQALGQTSSVAGFYYGKNSTYDDQRIVFTSGYKVDPAALNQGQVLVNANAYTGVVVDTDVVTPPAACGRDYALLTDVATSKNYYVNEAGQLLAAYFGDTFGNLWRYVPNVGSSNFTLANGDVSLVSKLSCNHPLHFSPTVVQLDRDDPMNHPREIYLVQVTNSALDRQTDYPTFPSSQLVIRKEIASPSGVVAADMTWGDAATPGAKVFTTGGSGLCADLVGGVCNSPLPPDARPASTPSAILKSDGTGFQVYTLWYRPAPDGCTKGTTYFTLHEIGVAGSVVQKAGFKIADEPVTSTLLVGGKLFYIDSQKGAVDLTAQIGQKFTQGGAISAATLNGGLRFQMTGWQELP